MAAKIRHLFRLYRLYARMDAEWFLQDTALCLICIVSETISNLAAITGVFLLSVQFGGVGVLTPDEVLFMLGFYSLATGLFSLFFGGFNTGEISRRIGRGQLDHCLIQPLPIWMQLITESFIPISGIQGALCGLTITVIALVRMQLTITPLWLLGFVLFLFASLAVQVGMR